MDTREMGEKAQEWQEHAQEQVQGLKPKARKWQENTTNSLRTGGQAVHEYVHENTWKSIGIAVAIGCVLGLLLNRSRDY
jgi:ElaB/YqjD/DUF883 family membrane-anchored ribosome-binding protein